MIDAGVNGFLMAGTAGEGAMLTDEVRYRVFETALDESGGRIPVLAGTGDVSTSSVKRHNKEAAKMGAAAALVIPPFYFKQDQQTIIDFYRDLIQEDDLPVMVYNFPQISKIYLEPENIAMLAGEGLAGVKDSSGDFVKFQKVFALQSDDFIVYQGVGALLLPSMLLGGHAWITPIPNVAPGIELQLYNVVKQGRIEEAKGIQAKMAKMIALWAYGGPPSTVQKAIMYLQGIGENIPVAPNPRITGPEMEDLRVKLQDIGLL